MRLSNLRLSHGRLAFAVALPFAAAAAPTLPAAPGATDPSVTQDNIQETICRPGWSSVRRPPEELTEAIKVAQIAHLGLSAGPAAYKEVHVIPLSLGGAPADPANLWPQPLGEGYVWVATDMGRLAQHLLALVCQGKLPLSEAQRAVVTDWRLVFTRYLQVVPDAFRPPPAQSGVSALQVKRECPDDRVVWVNTSTGVYHYSGARWRTAHQDGLFQCERAAKADGDRPAMNGQ